MLSYHLLLQEETNKNWNRKEIKKLFDDLIGLLEMRKLGRLHIEKGDEELPGLTASQIICTSHICFHHFSNEKEIWLDILSCKFFDKKEVKKFIRSYL
mgnify:CR=1 FL=1